MTSDMIDVERSSGHFPQELSSTHALGPPRPIDGLLGSFIGATLLASVTATFRKWRGIDGLGLGDQNFVATAGLWIGWRGSPLMLMIAATCGLSFAMAWAAVNEELNPEAQIPYGPFLGAGTLVAWLLMGTA